MLYTIGLLPHALLGYDVFCVLEISLTSSVTCVILGSYCVVVVCPLGAQKEGAAGFFKGMGKGLVGAVARPTGGFIDMVSSTFQGIKRCVCVCVCVCVYPSTCFPPFQCMPDAFSYDHAWTTSQPAVFMRLASLQFQMCSFGRVLCKSLFVDALKPTQLW